MIVLKIKTGDNVLVLRGKSKGKSGKVIQTMPPMRKVVVEGANILKKHLRSRKKGTKGQVIEFAAPIALANVKLICPACSKPARIGFRLEAGKKVRYCKKCKVSI